MKILRDIWSILNRGERRRLLLLSVMGILMALSTLVGVAAVLPFFTVITDPAAAIERHTFLRDLYELMPARNERMFLVELGVALVAIVIIGNVVNMQGARVMRHFSQMVGSRICSRLFDAYLHEDYGFHARADTSALATRVLIESGRVATGIVEQVLLLATNLVTIAIVVTSIAILNPVVALSASAALGSSYVLIFLVTRRKLRRAGQQESKLLVARGKVVHEGLAAIKEIIITQTQRHFSGKCATASEALARNLAATQSTAQSPKYILECITVAGLVGVALSLSSRPHADVPWLAQLTFFGFAAYRLLPALQQVFHAAVRIRVTSPALESIANDLRARRSATFPVVRVDAAWRNRPHREVRLVDLSFRYAPDLPPVLSDVNLRIPAGSITALVGRNGAGKTALADLMLALLMPQSGHMEVDGIRIDASNRLAWQSVVAHVPQQVLLLDASIAQNIAFGVPAEEIDAARLREAARLAHVDEFVASLAGQFDAMLGEHGIRLSGGMRQRIGIARALYRESAFLVLDEATSALDIAAERSVLATLRELRGARSIVVVAHSENVVGIADQVLEVTRGAVVNRAQNPVRLKSVE